MGIASDLQDLRHEDCRTLKEMKRVGKKFETFLKETGKEGRKEKQKQERENVIQVRDTLVAVSLLSWGSFLEMRGLRAGEGAPIVYFWVTSDTLHNVHLGILKILKECMVARLWTET